MSDQNEQVPKSTSNVGDTTTPTITTDTSVPMTTSTQALDFDPNKKVNVATNINVFL